MRLRVTHPHAPAAKINVTPLIDVVMVLIIFYLIVGNLAAERLSPVALPESAGGATEEAAPTLVISVMSSPKGPQIIVESKTVEQKDLDELLRARVSAPGVTPASASVHIRADRRLPWGDISPVIDACRGAGLVSVKLVAERGS